MLAPCFKHQMVSVNCFVQSPALHPYALCLEFSKFLYVDHKGITLFLPIKGSDHIGSVFPERACT